MYGAIDIGGTKTLISIFNSTGKPESETRFITPKDYFDFLKLISKEAQKLSLNNLKVVGIAVPGRLDKIKGIALALGNLPWRNVKIQDDLERIFHCPCLIENDAKLAALSEARALKHKYSRVLYITFSTGIGAGFVVDGDIDQNLADNEVGQMLFEHEGKLERWESFASGSAIVKQFNKEAKDITDQQTWHIIARNMAIGIIDLIATLTPDIIILGGSVGSHFEKYEALLKEELQLYNSPLLTVPPIVKAQRPEEAVVYGCLTLAEKAYAELTH